MFLILSLTIITLIPTVFSISCYQCESYRDFRCLDPMDLRPFPQVHCESQPWVRDKRPVFCEKVTELVHGSYVTTRGCSKRQWQDVDKYIHIRNQNLQCIRNGGLEICLCNEFDGCNGSSKIPTINFISILTVFIPFTIYGSFA